ncbi:glycosyltransferase [Winogradskyella psychrotolerans]|uniref:glycosyltransferase n=1 Tax=Winogradskyella psychrotolerans TaxID=1344585 RepID=UPI001C068D32|nr:glycosyltransferase [Winogradskyella psychrotolerans]MBU2922166.1 glycosyltransferase [Winogradskyella psychrotolerans]
MKKDKLYLIGPTESILTKRGNRFPNIAKFFVDEGEDIVYYTSNFYHAEKRYFSKQEINDAKEALGYELKVLKVLGYNSNVSPKRVLNNLFFSLDVFFRLLFLAHKNDRILLPSRPVELIFFMSLLKRLKGVRIYLDIQDIWPDALEIENKKKKRIFEFYCNMYLKPSLKKYDKTIYTAPTFKKWLHRYAENIPSVFIPLGWENTRWEDFNKKVDADTSILNMVCVAQLQHQIDVMPILEILKIRKDCHFTILGADQNGERYPEVKAFIDENNITNVKIIGKVKREDMKFYLETMDVGILPMITPSIPNKIFDYLAAELPIIVLGDNDSSDFVLQNEIGWSCGFNSNELIPILDGLTKASLKEKIEQTKLIKDKYSRDRLHVELKHVLFD